MKYRLLGRSGVQVSALSLGAMNFGSFANPDHGACTRIIHAALDAGINCIDTADVYSDGESEQIVTQQELEYLLHTEPQKLESAASLAMIQCVGPADEYCSRICCTTALKNAIHPKERFPRLQITIVFKDIRAYGFKERLYEEAREKGMTMQGLFREIYRKHKEAELLRRR